MIGTSVTYIVMVVLVLIISFARSFIEAAHDATGQTGTSATVYLWCNGIISTLWYVVVVWLVFVCIADSIW